MKAASPSSEKERSMTLTLTPETETRLRTMAEGFGLEPAALHEDLLQQALAEGEAGLDDTLAGRNKGIETDQQVSRKEV